MELPKIGGTLSGGHFLFYLGSKPGPTSSQTPYYVVGGCCSVSGGGGGWGGAVACLGMLLTTVGCTCSCFFPVNALNPQA